MTDPVRPVAPREPQWQQPDLCICQGNDPTLHRHYPDPPHSCARCSKCERFRPIERKPVAAAPVPCAASPADLKHHTEAVGAFLNELYAVMIDPLASGTMDVATMCEQLLAQAVNDRNALRDFHELRGSLRRAMHASAPNGYKCADCSIDQMACQTCSLAYLRATGEGAFRLEDADVEQAEDLAELRRDFESWLDQRHVTPEVRALLLPWKADAAPVAEGARDAVPGLPAVPVPPVAPVEELAAVAVAHDYVSTACQHQLHDRCRQTCKFCAVLCRCACHQSATVRVEE